MDAPKYTSDGRMTEIGLKAADALRDGVDPLTDAWARENALSQADRVELRFTLAVALRGTLLAPEPVRAMLFLAAASNNVQEARQKIGDVARSFVEPRAQRIIEKLQALNRQGRGHN